MESIPQPAPDSEDISLQNLSLQQQLNTNFPQSCPQQDKFIVYVRNLSFQTQLEDLQDFFSDCGEIKINMPMMNKMIKGFAFVEFVSEDSLQIALQKSESTILGRTINIEQYKPKSNQK